jgi:hypothetical protein
LAGQGPWLASPFGYLSLLVRSTAEGGGVASLANQTRTTALPVGPGLGIGGGWAFEFSAAFDGPAPDESACQILQGDEAGPQNALAVVVDDAYGATHQVTLYLSDDLGAVFSAVVPLAPGTRRQFRITWDGLTHRAFVDGTQVAAGTLRNPATITLRDASLYIVGEASAAGWTIFDFQYRLTG